LEAALWDGNVDVRRWAAVALGNVGPPAATAVPALVKVLRQDRDARARVLAATALAWLGPRARKAIPALLEALKDDDVRTDAGISLKKLVPDASALPALLELLRDKRGEVRAEAAAVLGYMGAASKPALPALIRTLREDKDQDVRASTCLALERIGPLARPA